MKHAAILARRDLSIGLRRLLECNVFRERHHALEQRIEPLEPLEIKLGQLHRAHLPASHDAESSTTERNASSSADPGRRTTGVSTGTA